MRILSVVGARPQFVKTAEFARACAELGIEHALVHTGQHYDDELSNAFFADLEIPDPIANLGVGSGSHAQQTAEMMRRLDGFSAFSSGRRTGWSSTATQTRRSPLHSWP